MPTNYPTSLDNFTNPTANDSLNLPSHSTQHSNANDAIEAIEAKLGTGPNVMPYAFACGNTSLNTSTETINFPVGRFTQTPIISIGMRTATLGRGVTVTAASTASFTVTGFVTTSGAATTTAFDWHAIQMTASSGAG